MFNYCGCTLCHLAPCRYSKLLFWYIRFHNCGTFHPIIYDKAHSDDHYDNQVIAPGVLLSFLGLCSLFLLCAFFLWNTDNDRLRRPLLNLYRFFLYFLRRCFLCMQLNFLNLWSGNLFGHNIFSNIFSNFLNYCCGGFLNNSFLRNCIFLNRCFCHLFGHALSNAFGQSSILDNLCNRRFFNNRRCCRLWFGNIGNRL